MRVANGVTYRDSFKNYNKDSANGMVLGHSNSSKHKTNTVRIDSFIAPDKRHKERRYAVWNWGKLKERDRGMK